MYIVQKDKLFSHVSAPVTSFDAERDARQYFNSGYINQPLVDWCRDVFGSKDKKFIDIGAGVGHFAVGLSSSFQEVHSFEPHIGRFAALACNASLSGHSHRLHHVGLSDHNSKFHFYVRSEDGSMDGFTHLGHDLDHSTPCTWLQTEKLDDYDLTDVGFIKLSVAGHEISVLQGAQHTLANSSYPPILVYSWGPEREQYLIPALTYRSELFDYLQGQGYKVVPIRGYGEWFIAERA